MKSKKSPKSDLERKRGLFLEVGLLLALAICLVAFEWPSSNSEYQDLGSLSADTEFEEEIDNTFVKPPPPPEEQPEEENINPEELNIKDNDEEVDNIDWDSEEDEWVDPIIIEKDEDVEIPEEKTEPIPISKIKDKPTFPGGDAGMMKFISKTYVYPPIPKENEIDGTVFVQFVVDAGGNVTNVSIYRGIDKYLDEEALRIVRLFPKWKPGTLGGSPVPVTIVLPITFKLE